MVHRLDARFSHKRLMFRTCDIKRWSEVYEYRSALASLFSLHISNSKVYYTHCFTFNSIPVLQPCSRRGTHWTKVVKIHDVQGANWPCRGALRETFDCFPFLYQTFHSDIYVTTEPLSPHSRSLFYLLLYPSLLGSRGCHKLAFSSATMQVQDFRVCNPRQEYFLIFSGHAIVSLATNSPATRRRETEPSRIQMQIVTEMASMGFMFYANQNLEATWQWNVWHSSLNTFIKWRVSNRFIVRIVYTGGRGYWIIELYRTGALRCRKIPEEGSCDRLSKWHCDIDVKHTRYH